MIAERCNRLAESPAFRGTVVVAIVIASLTAGLGTVDGNWSALLHLIDQVFVVFFLGEILIRITARNWKLASIAKDGWMLVDIAIVTSSVISQFIDFGESFYVFRLIRVLRLMTVSQGLQIIIESFFKSIKSSFYVVIMLATLLYIYAVLGVELFKDSHHFANLSNATISMIQVLTLDDWKNLLVAVHRDTTTPVVVTSIFFLSFIFFGTMIVLNLFVAIVTRQMRIISTNEKNNQR